MAKGMCQQTACIYCPFSTVFLNYLLFFQYMVLFQVHLVGKGIKEKEDTLDLKEKKVHLNNTVITPSVRLSQ